MKKALAGVVVVLFAGMLCGSMLAAFNNQTYVSRVDVPIMHPYTAY